MESFISEDKKTITLPIPLGSDMYLACTSCHDACTFQHEKFRKAFSSDDPEKIIAGCFSGSPCHTKEESPYQMTLNIGNIDWLIEKWGKTLFATEAEAILTTKKIVALHREQMLQAGLEINE